MVRLGEVALRSEATRVLWLALLLVAGAGNACTTNHDALALQPKAGAGGGGAGGSSSGFGGFGNTGDLASDGGRPNPDDEPKGDNVLTIVNGVIDAPSVQLCFAHVGSDGRTSDLVGSPMPALDYAASTVLTALDGFSLVDDVIQPWVIAGELSRIKKLNCEDAVALAQSEEAKVTPVATEPASGAAGQNAGGADAGATSAAGAGGAEPGLDLPTLRARPLAALPAGTVNIGRSILMVLTGCLGGAAYRDRIDTSACGADYTPTSPTVQPLVVKLSRDFRFDKVGLQAVHASLPTGSVDVRASGDAGAVSLVFASRVTFGAIVPRPANTSFTPVELGVDQPNYGLQAVGDSDVVFQAAWPDILAASGIDSLVAVRTYTAIFLGPDPLLIKIGWWNKSAFAVVDNDPTRK
jgi:hypothetical protein